MGIVQHPSDKISSRWIQALFALAFAAWRICVATFSLKQIFWFFLKKKIMPAATQCLD